MLRFGCINNLSVMNVDTTFQVGMYYITVITYKNTSLVKNCTNDFPVFLGPMHTIKPEVFRVKSSGSGAKLENFQAPDSSFIPEPEP
jgi:hypothetical protein